METLVSDQVICNTLKEKNVRLNCNTAGNSVHTYTFTLTVYILYY